MFSSIMVPEGVRRLFQVLTGEDMTDADEGGLFAVADALESGAVGVGEVGPFLAELVAKVRTEFSGKAADRFAGGLEIFDGLLASGEGALRELAVFVRDLARQVRYLKLVTIYGLELLLFEMAWAVYWAGATGGASMAWLAARMAVMRFLLSRWWGQLFMRLAMAAAGGVAFNVVPDMQAQLQMLGEKSAEKWDGKLTEQAAGMGAFSALVSLPLSAVGGLVSNALTKVLVKGLGDGVDEKILEAAAKKAVAEHAEKYPVSAMAKFADAVGEHLDHYAGMSVRGMWSARFGSGIGEALSEGLGELFGEVGYLAASGQEVTWNPFSVTAGVFESVFSGVGNLAGLAWRGKLHPEGPSPYLDDTSRRQDTTTEGGGFDREKTPLLGIGPGSQTGDTPGSPDKDNTLDSSDSFDSSDSSDASDVSDVDSVFSVSDTGSVDSAAVPVSSGDDLVVSGSPPVSAVVGGTDGKRGADDSVPGEKPARGVPEVPGSRQDRPGAPLPAHSDGVVGSGQDRSGTPLPGYSDEVVGSGRDRSGTPLPAHSDGVVGSGRDRSGTPPPAYSDGVVGSGQDRSGTPPPAYRPVAGGDQVPGAHGVDVPGNRPLEVLTSQTPDSPAVTPHASGAPADTALPETGRSGSVVDSDSGVVSPEHGSSPGGWTGRDADSHVDSVAAHGDSHRVDGAAVSPDSTMVPADGSQPAPYLHRDPAAALPVGLPVDAVRVPVPANVVAGGGLAEFVRGGVADSPGGPVLLVAQGNPTAGVVVSPGQGSALAQGMGRDVVALTSGQGERTPQWTVFGTDGSARPVAGPGAPVPVGGHGSLTGLADASTAVPVGPAASGRAPVGQWSGTDLRGEIDRARDGRRSGDDESTARRIVQATHDVRRLARGDAAVSLEDVVALVAAKHHELGDDHRNQVVEFSRALADRLGTQGSGLAAQAGAGPEGHTADGSASSGSPGSSRTETLDEKKARRNANNSKRRANNKAARRVRRAQLEESLGKLKADQASLEALPGWDGADAGLRGQWEALQKEIAPVQAEFDGIVAEDKRLRDLDLVRVRRYKQRQAALLGGGGSSSAGESAQVAGWSQEFAAAALSELITNAEAGLQRMRDEGWPVYVGGVDVGVDGLIADMRAREEGVGVFGGDDGLRNVLAHYMLSHPGDGVGMVELEERLHELTAAAQLDEWAGVAGRDAVDRLLVVADGILGPLKASGRFRVVLAHWLGEHPGDWQGVQVVRGGLADSLSGDLDLGMARSGLTRDAFEEVRAEEERWQADRAGNEAVAGVVAAPMVRGAVVDPGLSVIHQISSVKRTFADASRALRQLADEHGQDAVDRLYAPAEKVLGPLHESRPFRDVIAHELMKNPRDHQQLQQLMTNPQADRQLQQLRWRLVHYLAGDLGGGADSSAADDLLSATVTPIPGTNEARSKEQQMYFRRVAVGKALSGLPDKDAVERVLRDEARVDGLLGGYNSRSDLEARFKRRRGWADPVIADVRRQLTSDLDAAVGSLQQILAEGETSTDLRNAYEAKITKWSFIHPQTSVKELHSRVADASAAVRELRRNNAMRELRETYKTSYGGYAQLQVLHGRDHVVREFDLHFGGMQDDQLRDAVAHRLLTNGGQIGDAQAFLQRLHGLRLAASAVIAGAGPESAGDLLSGSTEDVSSDAETDDTESVFDEAERAELLERLQRLRGDAEPSESHRSSGLRESGGRGARSDEEFLADDSSEASSDSDVSESWSASGGLGGSVSSLESSVADVHGEIDRAKEVGWSSDDEVAARRIVQGTHDIRRLGRGDGDVSVNDVVALVAAKHHELGDDHQDEVVEFSQALAEKLGTRGSGLAIQAGAGPEGHTAGGGASGSSSGAVPRDVEGAHQRKGRASDKAKRRARIAELGESLKKLKANQASLEALPGRDGAGADRQAELAALQEEIAPVQAEFDEIAAEDKRLRDEDTARSRQYRERKAEQRKAAQRQAGKIESKLEAARVAAEKRAPELSGGGGSSSAVGSLSGAASAEVAKPAVVVELSGLVGHLEERLAAWPADFRPDVRAQVAELRNVVQQEGWTPEQLQRIAPKLEALRAAAGEYLRNFESGQIAAGNTAAVKPAVVVELSGLVGRMEEHFAALPADFRPDVRAQVAAARAAVQQEAWTPEQLRRIGSRLRGMRAAEQWLRDAPEFLDVMTHPLSSDGALESIDAVQGRLADTWAAMTALSAGVAPGAVPRPEDQVSVRSGEDAAPAELAELVSGGGGFSPAGGSPAVSLPEAASAEVVKPAVVVESGIVMSSDLDEDVRAVARVLPVEDGVLAVVVKGDGRGGVLIGGESADAQQLASLIRPGMVGRRAIRLYAGEVSEEFAQVLDGALDAEVIWTPDMVFGPETNVFGTWNTTRRDDSPPEQPPSDVPEQVLGPGVAEIQAGIMVSPSDLGEELLAVASGLPVEDGVLAVVVKGDGRGGVLIGGESADAQQLAGLIRSRMGGRRAIRLYACGVSEEFAQVLDGASGVEVLWTRGIVWFGPETQPFASMVGGWYLDEHSTMRPDYSQGVWETTRRGQWPSGQGPSDVSLPPGLPGLSPNWVHLRAETARFRAGPLPDLGWLRESEQAAKVAQARRKIVAAGEKLTQVSSMVDAPVLEAPASRVTAADSAETDALLKAATDETASADVSVGRAQRQAEKLTVVEGDLAEVRHPMILFVKRRLAGLGCGVPRRCVRRRCSGS
ncbi:WXG100-like domain-containing protein [Saccharopolyspora pogona]|uniref:WXG100-like domain-containing protein n=1 Tax=Saccharopolyspora pogona TaxID=333966 RepID=UPI0016846118|nr:hypothetical protein [Saccharopolyspora pogona]